MMTRHRHAQQPAVRGASAPWLDVAAWRFAPSGGSRPPLGARIRGFTLIELMIVIAVIALLMTLGAVVYGNVMNSAREKATQATIAKINGIVQVRQEAFQRAIEKADLSKAIDFTKAFCKAAFPAAPNPTIDKFVVDSASERTWEVLARKTYFRARFPMSFAEVCWFDGVPGTPADDDGAGPTNFHPVPTGANYYASFYSSTYGVPDAKEFGLDPTPGDTVVCDDLEPFASLIRDRMTNPTNHTIKTESAEMLYLILTGADLFGVPAVGSDEFSTNEVRDTDNDGLLEFVDGWGEPLRFYRWPTRLLRCGSGTTTFALTNPDPQYAALLISSLPSLKANDESLKRDSDDPMGLLYTQVIKRNPGASGQDNARQKLELLFHTPETYHTFLVVSSGQDKVLGLYEPCQFNLAGNIYGHLAQLAIDSSTGVSATNSLGNVTSHPLTDNITNRKK